MSKTLNQELRFWKVVDDRCRREVAQCHHGKLSKNDAISYASALCLQAMALHDVLLRSGSDQIHAVTRRAYALCRVHPTDLGLALKEWTLYFRNYFPRSKGVQTFDGFKHHQKASHPFVGDYMSPLRGCVESFFLRPTASNFTVINQDLSFLSRLSLSDLDFSKDCLRDYLENERVLADHNYNNPTVESLNEIMVEWLRDLDFSDFHPRHGGGSVAMLGRASLSEKYRNLGSDSLVRYFLPDYRDYYPEVPEVTLDRCCEVVFVPKSITSWRTISMEPPTLQYLQQGVWSSLDRHMSRHPFLSKIIRIHDQSFNRSLARIGSARNGEFATIDLSSASDLVGWELVKRVFRKTPLLRGCYATRSRYAQLPDGSRVKLRKFAPMGSALCFPVECLIFAAICEHIRRLRAYPEDSYSVYGDDIVVRVELAHDVLYALSQCGFKANPSKCFISQNLPFRESCGGEYFEGVDVSPFRLSRKFVSCSLTRYRPGDFRAYIDAANTAKMHGLKLVRLWFIHKLLDLPQRYQPLFTADNTGVSSDQPTNFHLSSRWHVHWQEEIMLCGINSAKYDHPIEDEFEDTIRLFEWHRLARFRSQPCHWPEEVITSIITRARPVLRSGSVLKS